MYHATQIICMIIKYKNVVQLKLKVIVMKDARKKLVMCLKTLFVMIIRLLA